MATAHLTLTSTISGASEGGNDLINITLNNTAAQYDIRSITATTNGVTGATTFTLPGAASSGVRQIIVVPDSTNTSPARIANSTADTGLAISSAGFNVFSLTTGISTFVIWTSATTAVSFRVIVL